MKYINFKYDLDNVIYYHELGYKFCYDQILYNFNSKPNSSISTLKSL